MNVEVRKPTEEERRIAKDWAIWKKNPSTFTWEYDQKETCLILEGKSIVRTEGETVEFGAGDYVTFPKGLKCIWQIKEKIKKHYKLG